MSQPNKVPKAIVFMGIRANDKSTFFQQNFAWGLVHISLGSLHTGTKEAKLLEECLKQRADFMVNNINPTIGDRKRHIQATRENGYEIEGYLSRSLAKDCIQRDSRRLGKACVLDRAIAYTSNRLEMPAHDEGSNRLYFVHTRSGELKANEWKNQCFNGKGR